MTVINQDTQLSTFPLIKAALLANSNLNIKFNNDNIYEYEPKQKGNIFKNFPYIWINIPFTKSEKLTIDHGITSKELAANIYLRVEYMARDKVRDYNNAIIAAVEAYETYFQREGYIDVEIELLDVDPNAVIHQKEIVESVFEVRCHGQVGR